MTPANESAPPADDQTVGAFLADHNQHIDTDRLDHAIGKLGSDDNPSRHQRLIKYAGWLMRDARAGIVTAIEARAALWQWWESSGVQEDYPRTWRTDFHRYIACAIGYANAEPDSVMAERLTTAKTWEPLEGVDELHADASPCTLTEAHAVARRWLGDEYDLDALDAVLATAAAERLAGDPLWLLLISGSGNAKTETVQAFGAAGAHVTSTITSVGALLSASPRKEKAKDATGGLLRKVGDSGVIVIKDVTSILSMDRNGRAEVLAALREVYDGRWERNVGTDGGRTLTWRGRLVVIGAVTTAWDRAHDVIASMGDRFVLLRMDSTEGRMQAGRRSIGNTGAEVQMRGELAEAVAGVLAAVDPSTAVDLTDDETERLLTAADIVTIGRTAVDYDYRGDVIDSHAPEMPTRFAKQLAQVVRGAVAIGIDRVDALRLAVRCARDSMPPLRLAILLDVATHPGSTTTEVRRRIDKPRATVDRQLQSLHMLGLLDCTENESCSGHGTQWRYSVSNGFNADALNPKTIPRNVTNYTQGHEKERSERPFATTHISGDGPDDGVS